MNDPQALGTIIKRKQSNDVINDNNDNKYVNKSKYTLNRSKFIPNTQEAITAEEIANSYNDLENYALYFRVVKTIGVQEAIRLNKVVKSEIQRKKQTDTPVRDVKRFFTYTYKHKKY